MPETYEDILLGAKTHPELKEKVISCYFNLIKCIANNYYFLGPTIKEDLLQEGVIGLIKAINIFDVKYGTSFSLFASFYIKREMQSFLRKAFLFHVPNNKAYNIFKLIRYENENASQYGATDLKTTSKKLKINKLKLKGIKDDSEIIRNPFSYFKQHVQMQEDPVDFAEVIDTKDKLSYIRNKINSLPDEDRKIIQLRYDENKSWREIGKTLGHTHHEAIRRKHDAIMKELRQSALIKFSA